MVGFECIVTFHNNGRIADKQKAFDDNFGKKLRVFLPLSFNNKKEYKAELSTAVEDTYPKRIVTIEGKKSETDLNCYEFDLETLYDVTEHFKIGLSKVCLYTDKRRRRFESELFRI